MSTNSSVRLATTGLVFAGTMLILNGVFQFFQGITGIAKDDVYLATPKYSFRFDTTTWGWIHLLVGAAVAVTGYFVLKGADWARGAGMGLAALSAFTNFLFLPYFPLWALTIIALDVFVIWALANAPARN